MTFSFQVIEKICFSIFFSGLVQIVARYIAFNKVIHSTGCIHTNSVESLVWFLIRYFTMA